MTINLSDAVLITCAVTGSADTVSKNPAVPVTPEEIANSAIDAAKAGAAIVHLHVRDPETGKASNDRELFRETVNRIRDSNSDVLLNLSTGRGARYVPDRADPTIAAEGTTLRLPGQRSQHVLALKPEICSLDIATMNRAGFVLINTPEHLEEMATAITAADVKPELEVFDGGHLRLAQHFLERGLLTRPAFFQFCLGIQWGMPATEDSILYLANQLPADAVWSAFGIGASEFPIVALAVSMNGHVRVGLEDNLYLKKGELAPSNAALVERAVQIIEDAGKRTGTPADARELLDLSGADR
jgi:uncharacterized protein (DUF849 family)